LSVSNIGITSPIYNQATYLPLNGAPGVKDVLPLALLLGAFFGM